MSYKVMIVDDAGFVREILSNMVTQLGHAVVAEAATGVEAVAKALQMKPDVIIMDLVLPEKNGIEAVAEIREVQPGCKFIAVSTIEEEFVVKNAMQAGCAAYLKKPFTKKDVETAFKQIQGRHVEVRHG
jgi:two-component system chemotaxis response regulator CheY